MMDVFPVADAPMKTSLSGAAPPCCACGQSMARLVWYVVAGAAARRPRPA